MGAVREIALTRGFVAVVDEEDFDWLSESRWTASGKLSHTYAVRSVSPRPGFWTVEAMHRLIVGAARGEFVDHINGDTLDNRRSNLRLCTVSQNSINTAKRFSQSGFRGVQQHGPSWRATIACGRKRFRLGVFADAGDAARAYDEAARRLHGEFARLNFPEAA